MLEASSVVCTSSSVPVVVLSKRAVEAEEGEADLEFRTEGENILSQEQRTARTLDSVVRLVCEVSRLSNLYILAALALWNQSILLTMIKGRAKFGRGKKGWE